MLVNFITDLGLYKILIEQQELKQYFGLIGHEDDSEQDLVVAEASFFCMSKESMTDAIRLIVLKKEDILEPNCQQCNGTCAGVPNCSQPGETNFLTKDGLLESENVSKLDEIMSDGSLDSSKENPVIVLFRIIFDQSNNRLTRVEMFNNLLVQKLWRTFAESRVFNLYLHTIQDKYGPQQFEKFKVERSRILKETGYDVFQQK